MYRLMPYYQKATDNLRQQLAQVMATYHDRLLANEVTIDVLMAFRKETDDYAVKAHGYGALATVKITPVKDRVKGLADAEIVVDGDYCDTWTDTELQALLDHELTHLELVVDRKTGNICRDDHGRPKLAMRLHDRQMGWFDEVAQRWGDSAAEVQQCKQLLTDWEFCQLYLPGFQQNDVAVSPAASAVQ